MICRALAGILCLALSAIAFGETGGNDELRLIPYPQEVAALSGRLQLGPPEYQLVGRVSETTKIATQSLESYLPGKGKPMTGRLGSV